MAHSQMKELFMNRMSNRRQGGFPCNKFCDQSKIEFFQCHICFDVCRTPVTCQSGHLFCGDCLAESLRRSRNCPVCQVSLTNPIPSPFVAAQVSSLDILCVHDECKWKGTCGRLDGHLDNDCLREPIKCSGEGGCGEPVPRGEMANHQQFGCLQSCPNSKQKLYRPPTLKRPQSGSQWLASRNRLEQSVHQFQDDGHEGLPSLHVQPQPMESEQDACNVRLSRNDLTNHLKHECKLRKISCLHPSCEVIVAYVRMPAHLEICPYAPVLCPLQCGAPNLTRNSLDVHKRVCPNEPVRCAHAHLGCSHVAPRGQITQHEQDVAVYFMGLSRAVAEIQGYLQLAPRVRRN